MKNMMFPFFEVHADQVQGAPCLSSPSLAGSQTQGASSANAQNPVGCHMGVDQLSPFPRQ